MYELEQVTKSLVSQSLGDESAAAAGEWRETRFMPGLDRLFREIGAYLEFVAIARGN